MWIVNHEGSTLVMPIGDLAQHTLSSIAFYTQNGFPLYNDSARKPIPGIDRFVNIVDTNKALPLTAVEQGSLAELTAELSTSCYAGILILQAMGLGGWMYDGVDRHTMLGVSGDPNVPGLGFRYIQMRDGLCLTQQSNYHTLTTVFIANDCCLVYIIILFHESSSSCF